MFKCAKNLKNTSCMSKYKYEYDENVELSFCHSTPKSLCL